MAGDLVTAVAANLVSNLIAPIGKQFGYVLFYKSYVEGLKKGIEELEIARQRVQHLVDEAVYDGKPIYTHVENWLKSAKEEAEKAENLLKRGENAKNACFCGWLPNPVVRHPIGREVKKITEVIQVLHEESSNGNFEKVYYENTPIGIVTATASNVRSVDYKEDVLESRAKIAEDIINAIADVKVCAIGVYGPGGVGKSKLLEDINRRVKEEKLFDVVAMTNVSRNFDLKRIQGEIAYALGLKLTNEETARGRADLLCKRLESDLKSPQDLLKSESDPKSSQDLLDKKKESNPKKKILIILDNLWEKLDLKEVGIPCGYDNTVRGCKLLLTSRYRDVLCTDMGSDREFRLNELEHEEARKLFERTVGDKVNDPECKHLVDGVVKNCGGLPLLIVSLAKRLKRGDLAAWRNASTNIDMSDAKSLVELNYKDLKDERIRSLFLVCALESGETSFRDSLIYCMGLGLYNKFSKTIEIAGDRLIMDLRSLQDSSLLLDSDDMKYFKMHDIFVDVAVSIAFTEWNALVGREDYGFKQWSKDKLKKCMAISFPFIGIGELPEKLVCPSLRILLLFEHNSSLEIPNSFFESMEKLQVLDITGLSFSSLPSSMEFLENLKSLSLDFCHLEDVSILGKLKGLQFLSFLNSNIARLPKEIGGLSELRFLDLRGCTRLKVIEPGTLESLVNLEELNMEDSFDQWEANDEAPRSNASLAELKNMKKLSTLYIAIPHSANLSRDLPFGKLKKYKIHIGDIWDWSSEYKESRILKLKMDLGNLLLEEWVQKCLQITQHLQLDGLQDANDNIHELCAEGFRELKHLYVRNSPSLRYVIRSAEYVQCTIFMRLESLFLENLNNLEKFCCSCLAPESFGKLKTVTVDNCGEINHLFPLSMTRIFSQLEEIEISECRLMQQIIADAEVDEIDDHPKVKSCNLRRLTLRNLPEMSSFYKTVNHSVVFFDGQQVSLPCLEYLTLSELPKLKEIWSSQLPSDVSNFKFLKVEHCASLLSIIPSNLLIYLQNLEGITVERCLSIRVVFDLEGLTVSGDVEILPRFTELTLSYLPSLGRIWSKNPRRALSFYNLRVLKVQNCGNLRFLFSSSMAKALVQIKEIEIASCELMEEIMDVQEEESEEAATTGTLVFPLLTSLSFKHLPNLRTFSYAKYCIHCPSLTKLRIYGCPKMMTFCSFEGKQQSMIPNTGLQAFGRINTSLSSPVFFNQNVLFPSLEELMLVSCGLRRIWHNELPEESFCRLASITVRNCENLSHIFPSTLIERFQSLEMIEVVNCTSLEALMEHVSVNTEKREKRRVLLGLKEVKLEDLPRLNAVVTISAKATLGLPSLTNVSLRRCRSLTYLFTNDTARTLDQLEMLDIFGCDNMQEVVAVEEGEGKKLKAVKFTHLRALKLRSLKSLVSFSSGRCAYEFPSLKEFTVEDCKAVEVIAGDANRRKLDDSVPTQQPFLLVEKVGFPSMETMKISHMNNMEKIWLDELPLNAFSKLKTLIVEYCEKLYSIYPSSTVFASFRNLKKLTVTDCGYLKVVFQVQELKMIGAHLTSSCQLRDLNLERLPKLKHVWSGPSLGTRALECLQCIKVVRCESLKSLFPSSVAKGMTRLEVLDIRSCGVEDIVADEDGGVGTSADGLFFPRLINLSLIGLPELRSFYRNGHTSTWPLLKELYMGNCGKMRPFSFHGELPSCEGSSTSENQPGLFSVEKVMPQLKRLTLRRADVVMMQHDISGNRKEIIVDYSHFREIFLEDSCGHGGATPSRGLIDEDKPLKALGNLKELQLTGLNNLRRVWKDGSLMAEILHQIEDLFVFQCPSFSILFPSSTSFQSLTKVEVQDCAGLVHMVTCSAVTSLVHLTRLILRHCGAIEDVVTDGGNEVEEISFPNLEELILDGLPSLESFSSVNCAFMFPSLVLIIVKHCPKMNIFCKGTLRTPKLDKVLLSNEGGEGHWDGNLNTTIQPVSARNDPH